MPVSRAAAFVSCLAAVLGGIVVAASPALAGTEAMRVYMDQARVLKLDRAVSKVIIGNAEVADATVADARTIVLTGKSFGTTNLVILDNDGNALVDKRIIVSIDEGDTVRVYRQTERSVLSCAPICESHDGSKASTGNGN
ncbi:pilus assembly protein N-terminal domain-containing protein [Rhizobium sp. SG2393]|uniref:pilus assembly protein N-terminal domain-containing protein n=1 Tax=Rhizobium sp. SG2393 TaxID=3276279 RepID=UPI00366CB4B8